MSIDLTVRARGEGTEVACSPYREHVEAVLDGLAMVDAPCPPMLAPALRYRGRRRFVAVYRTPDGAPRWNDGHEDGDVDPRCYATACTHAESLSRLPVSLWDRSLDATRALLVDLEELALYHGSTAVVETVLRAQPGEPARSAPPEIDPAEHELRAELGLTDVDDLIRWLEDPTSCYDAG